MVAAHVMPQVLDGRCMYECVVTVLLDFNEAPRAWHLLRDYLCDLQGKMLFLPIFPHRAQKLLPMILTLVAKRQ